jgi:arylsulfatase A-like enzyme
MPRAGFTLGTFLSAPERTVIAWTTGTALLAMFEWALVVLEPLDPFASAPQRAAGLLLDFGNLLPYTLAALLACCAVGSANLLARRYMQAPVIRYARTPAVAVAAFAALLSLPYSIWLARFTFSGPRARELPLVGLLVAGTAVLVCVAFGSATWFQGWRSRSERWWGAVAAVLGLLALSTCWLSRKILANEYEPLHAFLGVWAIVLCTLAAEEWARRTPPVGVTTAAAGGAIAVYCAVASAVILARADEHAWILWSQTAVTRYVTQRWKFLRPRVAPTAATKAKFLFKPDLESDQVVAWRRRRLLEPAPNIVVFSIDGLRPDHVGAYGYAKHPTTPNIDRFARRGVRFTRAYSSYPVTQNFNSALLLGRFVPEIWAHRPPRSYQEHAITRQLDQRNYHILVKAWFEHSSSNFFDPAVYRIDTNVPKSADKRTLETPLPVLLSTLRQHLERARERHQPVFVWMHLLSTHTFGADFAPHPDYRFGDSRSDHYDSAVAGADAWLRHVERLMQDSSNGERGTIWIICSDHGIRLDQAGRDLYEGRVRVPLIIVAPGVQPRVLHQPVDTALDLAATIVDAAGFKPPATYDGISLIPLLVKQRFSDDLRTRVIPMMRGAWTGAVYGSFKVMKYRDSLSLFDTRHDPQELHNLIERHAPLVELLTKTAEAELRRRTSSYYDRANVHVEVGTATDDEG